MELMDYVVKLYVDDVSKKLTFDSKVLSVHTVPVFYVQWKDGIFKSTSDIAIYFKIGVECVQRLYEANHTLPKFFDILERWRNAVCTSAPRLELDLKDFALLNNVPKYVTPPIDTTILWWDCTTNTLNYGKFQWKNNLELAYSLSITENKLYDYYKQYLSVYRILKLYRLRAPESSRWVMTYNHVIRHLPEHIVRGRLQKGETIFEIEESISVKAWMPIDVQDPIEYLGKTRYEFSVPKCSKVFDYVTIYIDVRYVGLQTYNTTKNLIVENKKAIFSEVLKRLTLTKQFLSCNKPASQLRIDNCTLTRQKILVFKIGWKEVRNESNNFAV